MEIIDIKFMILLLELYLLWIIKNQRLEKSRKAHFGENLPID